jgi:hypothetical protein
MSRDRCYDFKNNLAKKSAKIAVFAENTASLCKTLIVTIAFEINANFWKKIDENLRKL